MPRVIAVRRGVKGGHGAERATCESFEVDWKDEPIHEFLDAWESKNSDYKALWLTRFGKSL